MRGNTERNKPMAERIQDITSAFDPKRFRITISDPDASSVLGALKSRARSNLVQTAVIDYLNKNHPEPAPTKKSTRLKKKPQENMREVLQASVGDL